MNHSQCTLCARAASITNSVAARLDQSLIDAELAAYTLHMSVHDKMFHEMGMSLIQHNQHHHRIIDLTDTILYNLAKEACPVWADFAIGHGDFPPQNRTIAYTVKFLFRGCWLMQAAIVGTSIRISYHDWPFNPYHRQHRNYIFDDGHREFDISDPHCAEHFKQFVTNKLRRWWSIPFATLMDLLIR